MKNWFNVIWAILLVIASWVVNGGISQTLWYGVVIPVANDIGYTLPDVKTSYWVLLWAVIYIICMRPNKKSPEPEIDIDKMAFKLLMNWVLKLVYALIAVIITNICL
jgi:hypothetical protein